MKNNFVVFAEQVVDKAVESHCAPDDIFSGRHAAARIEQDPETDRHTLVAELRDVLWLDRPRRW
jgi:hypothetical protein